MSLTELGVRKLAPKEGRYEIPDGGGLYLRVAPSGLKSWVYRYTFDGRDRRLSVGQWPGIGIGEARRKAGEALNQVQQGIDPGQLALEKKAKMKAAPTVSELLNEFWKIELGKTPSGKERKRLVEKDVIPKWGKRRAHDITRRDAVLLLDKVRERAPITANRLQGVLVRMFNFASERGVIEHSPLVGMRKPKETPRKRVLNDEEIKLLWAALDIDNTDIDIYRVTKLALKMILLTGQRPGEVSAMAWAEVDEDEAFWNIPASRVKNSEPQRVPLCPLALEVLRQVRVYSGDSEFVFKSSHKKKAAITRTSVTRAVGRHWAEIGIKKAFTPHDLRRTLRTRLAEIGVSDMIAERVLGHKLQGMMAVYNQHTYDVEKRQALMNWEQRLMEIIGAPEPESNVVQFRKM